MNYGSRVCIFSIRGSVITGINSVNTKSLFFRWVKSQRCGCLVTWFCYQLIAKPGNKTAAPLWFDPDLFNLYWVNIRSQCSADQPTQYIPWNMLAYALFIVIIWSVSIDSCYWFIHVLLSSFIVGNHDPSTSKAILKNMGKCSRFQ